MRRLNLQEVRLSKLYYQLQKTAVSFKKGLTHEKMFSAGKKDTFRFLKTYTQRPALNIYICLIYLYLLENYLIIDKLCRAGYLDPKFYPNLIILNCHLSFNINRCTKIPKSNSKNNYILMDWLIFPSKSWLYRSFFL